MKRRCFTEATSSSLDASFEKYDPEDEQPKRHKSNDGPGPQPWAPSRAPARSALYLAFESEPLGLHQSSSSVSEPTPRVVEIPHLVDLDFIRRLFKPSSKYPSVMLEETGSFVSLSSAAMPGIVVSPDSRLAPGQIRVEEAVARVKGLFKLTPQMQATLVKQFCSSDGVIDQKVETRTIDFDLAASVMIKDGSSKQVVELPSNLTRYLMTQDHKTLLQHATGAQVHWNPPNAIVSGSPSQTSQVAKLLSRVKLHCKWGASEAKIAQLIAPGSTGKSVKCRLSPINHTLKPFEKSLKVSEKRIFIGKGTDNDVILTDSGISTRHCAIELDVNRGGTYIIDTSSHGTWLNGRRLPAKAKGKVFVSHGDEVLLKDPKKEPEFGYVVNLEVRF